MSRYANTRLGEGDTSNVASARMGSSVRGRVQARLPGFVSRNVTRRATLLIVGRPTIRDTTAFPRDGVEWPNATKHSWRPAPSFHPTG